MLISNVRIAQVSDMHLYADKEKALLGVKTYHSLSAVIDLIKQDPIQPDLLILSGDLAQDNTETAYSHIVDLFSSFSIPLYYMPGNHDDEQVMTRVLEQAGISSLRNIIINDWQLILLNSQKPHAVEGYLNETQLVFLETCLNEYPNHHPIVFLHHQPISVGTVWLDRLGLRNADQLWAILKNYPRVQHLMFGHIHQTFLGQKQGVKLYSSPSTCIQFKPNVIEFALDHIPPGYRWINLKEKGELETGIKRCDQYIGYFDATAKGY